MHMFLWYGPGNRLREEKGIMYLGLEPKCPACIPAVSIHGHVNWHLELLVAASNQCELTTWRKIYYGAWKDWDPHDLGYKDLLSGWMEERTGQCYGDTRMF